MVYSGTEALVFFLRSYGLAGPRSQKCRSILRSSEIQKPLVPRAASPLLPSPRRAVARPSVSPSRMGRKAGGLYINPKKFGGVVKPCMVEMASFLNCLALNKQNDDKCSRQKELLVACSQAQKGKPKNAAKTINYHLQRLGRDKLG